MNKSDNSDDNAPQASGWREKTHEIIFGADTPLGQLFDIALLIAIIVSVASICLETVEALNGYARIFQTIEWVVTILFTIEYGLRIACVKKPLRYINSFFGIVDLLAILPAYLGLIIVGAPNFVVIRAFRLLRVFRIFKLAWLTSEAEELAHAVWESRAKVVVFLATVLIAVTIAGSAMYEIEHEFKTPRLDAKGTPVLDADGKKILISSKFTSIPQAMYWAIVTMTTVGYGDVVPMTTVGKIVSAFLILLGYSLIIVPTGFISAEIVSRRNVRRVSNRNCPHCLTHDHEQSAKFCKDCGELL